MFSNKESDFEKLERLFWEFVNRYGEEGFEKILSNLDNPKKLGYSEKLVDNHISTPVCRAPEFHNNMKKTFARGYTDFLKYVYGVRLRTMAVNTLPEEVAGRGQIIIAIMNLPRGWPFTKFTYDEFLSLYLLLERLYFVQIEHKLGVEDLLNIYFSGLDERIVFFMDEFDIVDNANLPEPSKDYFQVLKYVKYQDETIKQMKRDLGYLIGTAIKYYVGKLGGWERNVLKTLIYCSAVSDGRKIIIREDIIRGYKTYFKLLNTDITKYKAREDVLNATNYDSFKAKMSYYNLRLLHGKNP
ncbi:MULTISPECIES: hypothetical protein [Methanobacterium]|jgi:hypothetical protein|uniref:Uncharacterized protein n=1 Tax=Methanobacterium subterraneum TaxID=59277 RepID=A0A2H4VRX1_9EURY|nr:MULTISPECIES: hypothetical protein [Methanobacterium]MBW4256214.1 hypothetical protein [Methanobacterium sp. YSL]AUB55373.1 hypothetical protein BK007_04635 [Methanobacterium subterraneum]AUB57650.1 hypothetical protein BK008_04545 [Methanobacterium sp. MZ-A1]AUB60780.1 hypothetical protein BK009_08905 [Methanobacterium subterraneum]MCC7559793.1 hypothetical protein [Methanobacterium sp.]